MTDLGETTTARWGDPLEAIEGCYELGWTDGLPVIPPSAGKVAAFVAASGRAPDEVIAHYPSRNRIATVEKVAINAVMAGCKPAYLPVVIAALEAVCTDEFNIHGVMATTMGASQDLIADGSRRMLVNAAYWCLGMEKKIAAKSKVDIVGEYKPTPFGGGRFKKGVKPADHKL